MFHWQGLVVPGAVRIPLLILEMNLQGEMRCNLRMEACGKGQSPEADRPHNTSSWVWHQRQGQSIDGNAKPFDFSREMDFKSFRGGVDTADETS